MKDPCAGGGGLCGSAAVAGRGKIDSNAGGRRVLCRHDSLFTHGLKKNQVCNSRTCACTNDKVFRQAFKHDLEVYGQAGFRVRTVLMDGEFEKLKPIMPPIECNTTAAK